MSSITSAEIDTLKQKASRRLSFRMSISKDNVSANASTQGTNSPSGISGQSVASNSTVEIVEEDKVETYLGAANAHREIQRALFSQDTPATQLPSETFSFPA
jgi:hypothetical protein